MSVIKKLFFLLLAAVFWIGCSKNSDDEFIYFGHWVEESPVSGRTELSFLTPDLLMISKSKNTFNEFKYWVEGDSIFLVPANSYPDGAKTSLFFRQSAGNFLQIQNLYPSIPEQDTSFIIFKRKIE